MVAAHNFKRFQFNVELLQICNPLIQNINNAHFTEPQANIIEFFFVL